MNWPIVTLGDIATFAKGSGLSKADITLGGQSPCVHYGELFTKYGTEIRVVASRTDRSDLPVRSKRGDILMPTSDVTPRGLAKASSIRSADAILGGDILIIRPLPDRAFGPFLAHTIRHDERQVLSLVRGSTVYHLYGADMRNFTLVLPPLETQILIADRLAEVDDTILALERLIVKKEAIKRGMMQQLLTGRIRLPGFSDPWRILGVPDLMRRLSTGRNRVPTSAYRTVGHIPIVDQSQRSIVGYIDDPIRALRVGVDGVIVFGDHTCVVKFVDHDFVIGADGVQVLAAREGNVAQFLSYALQLCGVASAGYNRHFGVLMGLELRAPRHEEQQAICSVINDVDSDLAALRLRLVKVKNVKRGMMQELLTGRTRLPVMEKAA